jgi:nucleotide-binding universal stress UspA family protein
MKKAARILVGLKTNEHAIPLTDLACRIGARGAHLLLVHVIELPDTTPLDAEVPDLEKRAQQILRAGERVARRSRMKVNTLILRARSAGRALLDEMKERKIELAVLGSHHGRSLGELFLGTTHQFLVRHAPCQVLLSIPPRKQAAVKTAAA